jgi:hypothetical protein
MEALDFSRSFVTFVTKGRANNARIQVECCCRLTTPDRGPVDFLLVASCKAEDTYAEDDLFRVPNYDFCGIFSSGDYQIIRTHETAALGGKETGIAAERFEEVLIDCVTAQAKQCSTPHEIVAATLANRPLVGRTELQSRDGARVAVLEYPVKTMNANDQRSAFQIDTGPVLFPDLEAPSARAIECFELAFIAWNRFDRAEFILQRPTPVPADARDAAMVPHYSVVRKVAATNTILAQ